MAAVGIQHAVRRFVPADERGDFGDEPAVHVDGGDHAELLAAGRQRGRRVEDGNGFRIAPGGTLDRDITP